MIEIRKDKIELKAKELDLRKREQNAREKKGANADNNDSAVSTASTSNIIADATVESKNLTYKLKYLLAEIA